MTTAKNGKKILFFGPMPPPITGQSIAFKEVYEEVNANKRLINTTYWGNGKILNTIYSVFRLIFLNIWNKFDVVYFTCSRSKLGFLKDFVLIIICSFRKIKIVNHLHGADFITFYNDSSLLKPFLKYSYNRVDSSIVLFDKMKSEFAKFPKMELFTVNNSYSKIFDINNYDRNLNVEILFFSNIMKSKGILELLESAAFILGKFNNVKYVIVGAFVGDEYTSGKKIKVEFEKKILELQQLFGKDSVRYLGTVSGRDKVKVFQESSIFVLPTYYKTEACPLTIIEAMRSGNAIISTDHNYISEIVGKRNGILIQKKSVQELITAQMYLIEHPTELKNIQSYNREFAQLNYSPQKYLSKISEILFETY